MKIIKYEIDDTYDIESHRWLANFIVVKVLTPILSTDNSFHIAPVYDKTVPGCDKHRINHISYWRLIVQSQAGLTNTG